MVNININWQQKLTSRKFWAAVVGFVSAIMALLGYNKLTTEQVTALISAVATLIAYILGEGIVDTARICKGREDTSDEHYDEPY